MGEEEEEDQETEKREERESFYCGRVWLLLLLDVMYTLY